MVLYVHKLAKVASYPLIGLYFIIYILISSIKYTFIGIEFIAYIEYKYFFKYVFFGLLIICLSVFKILKYALFTLKIPFILILPPKLDKNNIEPDFAEELDNRLFEFVKSKNDLRIGTESVEIPQTVIDTPSIQDNSTITFDEESDANVINDSNVYLNKNVKLNGSPILQQIKDFLASIGTFFESLSNKGKNNIFSKNKRNKQDMKRQALLIDFEGEDAIKSNKKVLYQYIAKDTNGKIIKDYFDAYSKVEVHSYLLSEGYEVYSIKTNKWIQILHAGTTTNRTKFKNKDLIFFLTQLSTYLKAGIPLVEALKIISRQYKKKKYKKIFKSVIYELSVGESLSSGMEKQGGTFPKLLINMIKTAEMTGSLPEVLDDMANYYTEAEATRKQMITAMTYPSIVLVFSVGVMTFVMIYVVPKFVEIYDTMETELPGITKVILGISSFLTHYWYLVIIGIIVFIVAVILSYKKIKGFRTIIQYVIMHMPVFKNVVIYNEVTMFTKTFASLLSHNVPITDSMEILNKITNNEIYKMLILDTITNLARGGKISDAFKDHWAFPLPAYEMIVTGEETGELSEMMGKVSTYYQDLHKNSVTRIKTFIEPALTVFLTVGVGVILLSIIIPMFNMYSAVQGME